VDRHVHIPIQKARHVGVTSQVDRAVEVSVIETLEKVVDVPVIKQVTVPTTQTIEKIVEVPFIQTVEKVVEIPMGGDTKTGVTRVTQVNLEPIRQKMDENVVQQVLAGPPLPAEMRSAQD